MINPTHNIQQTQNEYLSVLQSSKAKSSRGIRTHKRLHSCKDVWSIARLVKYTDKGFKYDELLSSAVRKRHWSVAESVDRNIEQLCTLNVSSRLSGRRSSRVERGLMGDALRAADPSIHSPSAWHCLWRHRRCTPLWSSRSWTQCAASPARRWGNG